MKRHVQLTGLAAVALTMAFGAACASGGSSVLSQTDLTGEQLAEVQYETAYDFLRAHNRARIIARQGDELLTVFSRGGDIRSGQVSGRASGGSESFGAPATGSQAATIDGAVPEGGLEEALLYVNDNQVRGNVTQILRDIPLSEVASLRILRPSETSARYGGDGRVGAVLIIMKGDQSI